MPNWRADDQETARSLSALLDVRTDKVLCVFLEDVINLVEQIVGLLGELFAALLARGCSTGDVVVVTAATATLGLLLSHRRLLLKLGLFNGLSNSQATRRWSFSTLPVNTDVSGSNGPSWSVVPPVR